MVKRVLYFIILIIISFSCRELSDNTKSETSVEFNTKKYELSIFGKRVLKFLKARAETKHLEEYDAFFVNFEKCVSCTKGAFEALNGYFEKTKKKTFIYTNDNVIKSGDIQNSSVQIINLPKDVYTKKDIFHSNIYKYHVSSNTLESEQVEAQLIESLLKSVE